MADSSRYFRLYFDNAPALYRLSDAEAGKLLKNICRLGRGEDLAPMNDKTAFAFDIFAAQFSRDSEFVAKMAAIGSAGGRKSKRRLSDAKAAHKRGVSNIDIDNNIDSNINIDSALRACFDDNRIPMSARSWQWLTEHYEPYGLTPEMVALAVNRAIEHNARSWVYVQTIFEGWNTKGIRTLEAAEADTPDTGIFERPGSFDPKRGYE